MKDDEREIVSLRNKEDGMMVFGYWGGTSICDGHDCYGIVDSSALFVPHPKYRAFRKDRWTIHRNLAAIPDEDFGRKLESRYASEKYYGPYICLGRNPFKAGSYMTVAPSDGIMYNWEDVCFLDDTPDIKITVEIGGKETSLVTSEETLQNILKLSEKP